MAHSTQRPIDGGRNIYQALLDAEQFKFEKRGGGRRLISKHGSDEVIISKVPSARLAHLRAGEPAEFYVWELPKPVREGRDASQRVTIWPDGRVTNVVG